MYIEKRTVARPFFPKGEKQCLEREVLLTRCFFKCWAGFPARRVWRTHNEKNDFINHTVACVIFHYIKSST